MRLGSNLQRPSCPRAWLALALALLLAGGWGCGSITAGGDGGGTTGSAGTSGGAGTSGSAGTSGGAGTSGSAGTSGGAGTSGTAGAGGRGGTTGAGGVTGAGGRGGTTGAGGVTGAGGRGGTTGAGGVTGAGGRGGTTGAGGVTGAGGRGGTTGAAGASGGSGRGGGGASGGGGAGQSCGNGATCTSAQFCDWTSNRCGTVDMMGSCQARPQGCTAIYAPVCACDGKVYASECDANGSGQDVSDTVSCTPPTGMFGCGHLFCSHGTQYCQATLGGAVDNAGTYVCQPLPAACNGTPTCACITGAQCGNCKMTTGGEVMTSCLVP